MTRPDHLDVEFRADDLPATATDVVAACGDGLGAAAVWAMPVSSRVAALLTIVQATCGRDVLEATTVCACGERTSLELPVAQLIAMSGDPDDVLTMSEGRRFRRPLGRDQQRWRERTAERPADTFAAMVRDLALDRIEGPLSADSIEAIGQAFEEFDPLSALRLDVECAHCGRQQRVAADLQELCLIELLRVRERRVREVHVLARAYGWSEESILALSNGRRQLYLRLIDEARR